MAELSDIVLQRPDGSDQPLAAFAGRPTLVQLLRYFG